MKHTQVNHKKAALLGLQHLLAMYSGAIAVPLLIGTALKFNSTQMTYLVSIDIFMCGLATALQLLRNRYFGIGLPVVLGYSSCSSSSNDWEKIHHWYYVWCNHRSGCFRIFSSRLFF